MKVKTDLDKLEERTFEILKQWQTEHFNAIVPTSIGDVNELIANEVKGLLLKLSKAENK